MSKDLFFNFIKNLDLYEDISLSLGKKVKGAKSLYLNCKDLYGKTIPTLDSNTILQVIKGLDSSDNIYNYIPTCGSKNFQQSYIIFAEKVRLWEIYLNHHNLKPFMRPIDLIKESIKRQSDFADYLKQLMAYSIRSSIGLMYYTNEEHYDFVDINQIFPAKHLINFVRPKDISDLTEYANKKPSIKGDRHGLQKIMEKNIQKGVNLRGFDLFDHIDNMDEKGSFVKGVTTFNEKILGRASCTYPDHLKFRINSIQKTPCESRTIAIAEPLCKAFLSYTKKLYSPLLKAKYDFYGRDRWSFEKYLHEKEGFFHFLFDQKKCGWTFPMELIEDFFDSLYKIYPITPFKKLYDIFRLKDIVYLIEGREYRPDRGYTLGMFDDICSFIISCCFEMLIEHLENEFPELTSKVQGLFFGDDCDIIVQTEQLDICKLVSNKWLLMLDSYGVAVNLNKSFYSKSGIFCEVYGLNKNIQMQKHLYYILNGLDILTAYNTAHGKELFSSYFRIITTYLEYVPREHRQLLTNIFNDITSEIISSFPYEFLENESIYPFEVGGWTQHLKDGKNQILIEIVNRQIHPSLQKILTVKKPQLKTLCKKSDKDFINKVISDDYWSEIEFALKFDLSSNTLEDKYYQSLSRSNITAKQWWKYQEMRQKAFNSRGEGEVPISQIPFILPWFKKELCKDLFEIRTENLKYCCPKKPKSFLYHEVTNVSKKRALDIMRNIDGGIGPYYGCHYPDFIGIKDIYTALDKNLAKCKYMIPTDWWLLCTEWDISIEKMYHYLVEEGFDPFLYKPKGYRPYKKDNPIFKLDFDLSKPIICWCDLICRYITLEPYECMLLNEDIGIGCLETLLMTKVPGADSLDLYRRYIEEIKIRSITNVKVIEDDLDLYIPPEELQYIVGNSNISGNLISAKPLNNQEVKIGENISEVKTLEYVARVIEEIDYEALANQEDDDADEDENLSVGDNNWEEANLGHDDVLDYYQQYLQNVDAEESGEEEEEEPP